MSAQAGIVAPISIESMADIEPGSFPYILHRMQTPASLGFPEFGRELSAGLDRSLTF
jgi:hypothetical protein